MKTLSNMMLAVMMLIASGSNLQAANINYDKKVDVPKILQFAKELDKDYFKQDSTSIYDIDLNKNFNKLSKFLKLNVEQSNSLYEVHDCVMRELALLDCIKDMNKRSKQFNSIIDYWHRESYYSIVYNSDDFDVTAEKKAKEAFRVYWCIVNATVQNRGLVNSDGTLSGSTFETFS